MKLKTTTKSETTNDTVPEAKSNEILLKDEIKEIVEETVEEMMKVTSKKEARITADVPSGKSEVIENTVEKSEETENVSENSEMASDTSSTPGLVIHPSPVKTDAPKEPTVEEKRQEMVLPPTPVVTDSEDSSMEPVITESDSVEVSMKKSRLPLLLGFLIALVLLGGGGYWYLSSHTVPSLSLPGSPLSQKITPTKAPTITLTPLPKEVDLTKYSVSVLNGSGVSGAALKVKTTLSDAGFKVTSTGNANSSDIVDTFISAKAPVDEAFLIKLTDTLGKTYKVSSEKKKLDSSATEDVTVTLGSSTK